jgi:hypothetical protein
VSGLTLKNKVNNKKAVTKKLYSTQLGRKPVLSYNFEDEFFNWCLLMERTFLGLTTRSIKQMAFELAIKMILSVHNYCNKEEQAGSVCVTLCVAIIDWGLLKPQVTSAARVKGFKKINVPKFFSKYKRQCCS